MKIIIKKYFLQIILWLIYAKISPSIILEGSKPRRIDEWQEAINLWYGIRIDVDKTGLKGQYILAGSSTPNRKGISHSGAGRYGKIQLFLFRWVL